MTAPPIPPRIAARAKKTCEAEQRQVGIGFPPGVTGEPHHGPTPPFYDCTCDLIAAVAVNIRDLRRVLYSRKSRDVKP